MDFFGSHKGLGYLLYHAVLHKVMHFVHFSRGVAKVYSYEDAYPHELLPDVPLAFGKFTVCLLVKTNEVILL